MSDFLLTITNIKLCWHQQLLPSPFSVGKLGNHMQLFDTENESLAYFENVPNQASQLYFQHVLNIIMNIFEIHFVVIMKKIL